MDIIYEVTSLVEMDAAIESFNSYSAAMEGGHLTEDSFRGFIERALKAIKTIVMNLVLKIGNFIRRIMGKKVKLTKLQADMVYDMAAIIRNAYEIIPDHAQHLGDENYLTHHNWQEAMEDVGHQEKKFNRYIDDFNGLLSEFKKAPSDLSPYFDNRADAAFKHEVELRLDWAQRLNKSLESESQALSNSINTFHKIKVTRDESTAHIQMSSLQVTLTKTMRMTQTLMKSINAMLDAILMTK